MIYSCVQTIILKLSLSILKQQNGGLELTFVFSDKIDRKDAVKIDD